MINVWCCQRWVSVMSIVDCWCVMLLVAAAVKWCLCDEMCVCIAFFFLLDLFMCVRVFCLREKVCTNHNLLGFVTHWAYRFPSTSLIVSLFYSSKSLLHLLWSQPTVSLTFIYGGYLSSASYIGSSLSSVPVCMHLLAVCCFLFVVHKLCFPPFCQDSCSRSSRLCCKHCFISLRAIFLERS